MDRRLALLWLLALCVGCSRAPVTAPPQRGAGPSQPTTAQPAAPAPAPAQPQRHEKEAMIAREAPAPANPGAAPSLGEEEQQWFDQLKSGGMQYEIPSTMFWKEASTVTVAIQGPQAPASAALQGPAGAAAIKVSNRMKVVIASPDDPNEFTIVPEQGTQDTQFVPSDAGAIWNYSVTPKYTGLGQKLSITAWVLYPGHKGNISQQLPVYSATVDVHVPSFSDCIKRLIEGDPDCWLKYGLPGGGGFVFVAGVVGWFVKRHSRRKGHKPQGQ